LEIEKGNHARKRANTRKKGEKSRKNNKKAIEKKLARVLRYIRQRLKIACSDYYENCLKAEEVAL